MTSRTSSKRLSLIPWPTGALSGRTLYGIVEMHGPGRFLVDVEPADTDGSGSVRPSSFSRQSVTFVRKLN